MSSSASITAESRTRPSWAARVVRGAVYGLVLVYFLLAFGYLALRYHVWPNLDDWRPRIVAHLSEVLGRPVGFAAISTSFDGWQPVLQIRDLQLSAAPGSDVPVLRIPELDATLALRSFLTGQIRLARLQLTGPELDARRSADGKIYLAGIELGQPNPEFAKRLEVFLAQRHLGVRNGRVNWRDELLGQSQVLTGVDIDIDSFGLHHRLDIKAQQVGALAQKLDISADLFRQRGVAVDRWPQWHGDIYAAADELQADAIKRVLGLKLPVNQGTGAVRFWARLEEARLNDMQLKLFGQSLRVELPEDSTLTLQQFGGEASAVRRPDGGFNIVVRSLFGQTDGGFAVRALGNQSVTTDADGAVTSASLAIEDIGVSGALALLKRLPLPAGVQAKFAPLRGRGRLRGLQANFAANPQPEFDVNFSFDQLSLVQTIEVLPASEPRLGLRTPSLENVSGTATIKNDGGRIQFFSKNAALTLPGIFEDPRLIFDELKGKVDWQQSVVAGSSTVDLVIESLEFSNTDAAGSLSGRYRSLPGGPGLVDIRGALSRGNAARVARYLPLQLPPKVRDWVGSSIQTGKIAQAQFGLKGDLLNFPFRSPAEGEFVIDAKVLDARLDYAPEWPPITGLQGTIRFAQGGMDLRMNEAQVFGVTLGETQAQIVDFREPLLSIESRGLGPVQDMLRFVNESPVAGKIDGFTRESLAKGNAQLKLQLELPLDNLKAMQVKGTVEFDRNDLQLDASIPKFDAVSGKLSFSNDGLTLSGMSAGFLGGSLQLDGTTPESGRFLINARGSLSAENLRELLDHPLSKRLTGQTDYRATVDVFKRKAKLTIESDLRGLASDLPEPFKKAAEQSWPLQALVTPSAASGVGGANDRGGGDRINITLNEKINLVFERSRDPILKKLQIERGAFAYDAPAVLDEQGFVVLINRKDINVDRWLDVLTAPAMQAASSRPSTEFAAGFSLLPNIVSIVSDEITIAGKALHEVVLGASRKEGFWRANVSSRELSGYFNWSAAREGQRIGALTARFTRLEIPASRRGEIEELIESSPQELPSLDIAAEEFVLAERSLGKLSLQATTGGSPELPTWHLNKLLIENPDARFQASGVWEPPRAGEARKTRLDYQLAVVNSGDLLGRYGMKNVIKDAAGALTGTLSWDGSPIGLQKETLAGSTEIKLGKGQFLKTDPGLAKLIGVLNLQFLPRRLSLDFSDVFAEGFSFDEIEGTLTIDKGQARTDSLVMKGVQARVRLKGEVNLAGETQKLEVEVRPELNAGVASLAYAALANPALGLTTFLAQLLLRRPLEDIFTYNYDVTGTWADPQVLERRSPTPERPKDTLQ
jgi:uncharacterized protein (TIGR02099 family)